MAKFDSKSQLRWSCILTRNLPSAMKLHESSGTAFLMLARLAADPGKFPGAGVIRTSTPNLPCSDFP
jgi:hypothetical protein